jgi:hypothetical protein
MVRAAVEASLPGLAVDLGRALMPVMEAYGRYDRWAEVSEAARAAATRDEERAPLDAGHGTLLHYRNDMAGSAAALTAACDAYLRIGDRLGLGYAQVMLAMTRRAAHQPVGDLLVQALLTARDEQDPVLEVEALRCQAWQDRDRGDGAGAVTGLMTALGRARPGHAGRHPAP